MTRLTLIAALCAFATPTLAADKISKEDDCGYQGDVVGAIQVAHLARVKEANLTEAIAKTEPTWPDQYNKAIPLLAGPIYDIKRRDLKDVDLAEQWKTACLSQ